MFFFLFILINFKEILSIEIGTITHSSIQSDSSFYRSLKNNCTDCLCNCLQSSSCSGINCFPTYQTCQFLEQQKWILESDLSANSASKNFIAIKANTSRFCSCYTASNILNQYGQINSIDTATTAGMRSIKYISNDDTVIVLNSALIQKLSANNLSNIQRSLSGSSGVPVSILHNDTRIYIAFAYNRSINMYDLNLNLLETSISWSNQSGYFGGMLLFNDQILIMDIVQSTIWSISSLNQSLNKFFDFSSYSIDNPKSLFIYQNQTLYIPSASKNLYLFNITNFTLQQTLSLSVNTSMVFMRYDSNCNRLWFGTQNYTYAPVVDLASNQMNTYITKGSISGYGIYSIDFNENYTAFYIDYTNGYVRRIDLPNLNC